MIDPQKLSFLNLKNKFFVFCLLFILSLSSYFYTLNAQLIGDDNLRLDEQHRTLNVLMDALTGELSDRPLLMTSMWMDRTVFNLSYPEMRAENVLWHCLVALIIYLIILDLGKILKRENQENLAFSMALLFALHPLHNQAINIIIQRGAVLAAFFGLLSFRHFILYSSEEKRHDLLLSWLFFGLSIFSKQNASFLAILYLLIMLHQKKYKHLQRLIPYILLLLFPFFNYYILKVNDQGAFSKILKPWAYFLVQTQVLFTYFGKILLPWKLQYLFDFSPPKVFFPNIFWLYLSLHIMIIAIALKKLKTSLQRFFFIGFYLSFMPESGFFPILHLAFEHRVYIPLVFFFLFMASYFMEEIKSHKRRNLIAVIFVSLIYLGLNQKRNYEISTPLKWELNTLQQSTSHHDFNFGFCIDLMKAGYFKETDELIKHYLEIFKDDKHFLEIYQILPLYHESFEFPERYKETSKKVANLLKVYDGQFFILKILAIGYLYQVYLNDPTDLEYAFWAEEVISHQIKVLAENPRPPKGTKDPLISYYHLSSYLLDKMKQDTKLKESHYLTFLKIRAIHFYYYKKQDDSLTEDIKKELTHFKSENVILNRLLEMATKPLVTKDGHILITK
jgi:hypothetical protein